MSAAQTVALFGGLAAFNLVACLPVLIFRSVRRLLDCLPGGNLAVNYVLAVAGFTVLHSAALLATVVISGGLQGVAALWGLGLVSAGAAVSAWLAASLVLPRLGYWNPRSGDGIDGRVALGLALLWYLASILIGLFLLVVLAIAFFFPG